MTPEDKVARMEKEIKYLRLRLLSPKFTGYEADGSRKDWIFTGDLDDILLNWLMILSRD